MFQFNPTTLISEADQQLAQGLQMALDEIASLKKQLADANRRLHRLDQDVPREGLQSVRQLISSRVGF